MALTRAIATAPGAPSAEETLTAAEETAQLTEWSANQVDSTRAGLRRSFKAEGLRRIALQEPAWDTFETVALIASIWTRLGAPSVAQVLAKDIYLYVRDTALPKLAAVTTQAALDAIDPTAADPFGDGTPWPT